MNMILVTTPTCGKCKMLKPILAKYCEENSIKLDEVDAASTLGSTLVSTYQITQAPTLFIYDEKGDMIKMMSGDVYMKTIKDFLESGR